RKRPFPRPPESVTAWKNLLSFVFGSMKTFDATAYHESLPSVLPPPAMKAFSTPTATADVLSSIRFTWNENDVRLPNPEWKVESDVTTTSRPTVSVELKKPRPPEIEPSSPPLAVRVPLACLMPRVWF